MTIVAQLTPMEQVKGGEALRESGAELWVIDMPAAETLSRNPKPFHHTQASPSPQSLTITTAVPSRHSPQQSDTVHIHPTITHTVRTTVYTHRAPHTAVTVALHCTVGTVCTGRNTGPLDPAVDFPNSSDTVP